MKRLFLVLVSVTVLFSLARCAYGKPLEGEVEAEDEMKRIPREHYVPSSPRLGSESALPAVNPSDYIQSAEVTSTGLRTGIENNAPLMTPSGPFDIGADRNIEDLRLAWERWHKQVSHELYIRTGRRALRSGLEGGARATIQVSRDHRISGQITETDGSPFVAQAYSQAISSLYMNDGLEFPAGSQRDSVSFSYKYIQGRNIVPGYDWQHGDVESIHHEF